MIAQRTYPPGVPCWVEVLQANPRSAGEFYAGLFGWRVTGPGPMPDPSGEYFVAQCDGHDVAGIATLPPNGHAVPAWTTYIRVADVQAAAELAARSSGSVIVPPFDAPPAGRAAILAGPDGSVFGIWEAAQREGAQLVNAPNAWKMSTLRTNDLPGAANFYGTLFGWQTQSHAAGAGTITLARVPGYVGGVEEQPVPRDVAACLVASEARSSAVWSVEFWVDDTDAAIARALRLGGSIVVPANDTPMFRQAVLADREGAIFSISQLKFAP